MDCLICNTCPTTIEGPNKYNFFFTYVYKQSMKIHRTIKQQLNNMIQVIF